MDIPDIDFFTQTKMSRRAKFCLAACILILVGLALYIFFRDDRLLDDTDLNISFPAVPSDENGLRYLLPYNDLNLFMDDEYGKIRAMFGLEDPPLAWDSVQARGALARFTDFIQAVQSASTAKYIQSPPLEIFDSYDPTLENLADAALLIDASGRVAIDDLQLDIALKNAETLLNCASLVATHMENSSHLFVADRLMEAAADIIVYMTATDTAIPRDQFLNVLSKMEMIITAVEQRQDTVHLGTYQVQKHYFLNYADTRWGKGKNLQYRPKRTANQLMHWFRVERENIGKPMCDHKWASYTPSSSRIDLIFNPVGEDLLRTEISNIHTAYIVNIQLSEFELAMTIAALRLYHQDKDQLPESLPLLAPAYLKKIPSDRFDGKAMRYDKKRARVWCVGRNLVDDNSPPSDDTIDQQLRLDPMRQIKWLAE